jgi:hypothetical protein
MKEHHRSRLASWKDATRSDLAFPSQANISEKGADRLGKPSTKVGLRMETELGLAWEVFSDLTLSETTKQS